MPKCYQLVGVPASGKSTWFFNQNWTANCAYISTDKLVENYAREQGKTYSQVFDEFMPVAVRLMREDVIRASQLKQDIIWDQTSVSIESRRKKFKMLPNYEHIAVVFPTPEHTELSRRLAGRPGKHIPDYVVSSMIASFQLPTEKEGFKEIWYAA